jgi:hypothetical protein
LLSDPAFGEEFDTVVDEITDEYLRNELTADERERIQKYFFSSAERQKKLAFAVELLDRAKKHERRPTLLAHIAAFFRQQSFAHVALTAAAVVIVAGTFIYFWTRPATYLALNLTISTAERSEGVAAQTVKLPSNTGLKIALTIPESARGAKGYAARLAGGNTDLTIDQRTEQAITVVIPAGSLTPGTYAIQLLKLKPDNTHERIPGSYYFAVE